MKSMNLFSGSLGSIEPTAHFANNPYWSGQYGHMLNNLLALNPRQKNNDDDDGDAEDQEDVSFDDELNNDLELEVENESDEFEDDDFEDENFDSYA